MKTIAFMGAGNMARSLIGGLIAAGFSTDHIWATDRNRSHLEMLRKQFCIQTTENNKEAAVHADVILICVKPKDVFPLCGELREINFKKGIVFISIATGITTQSLKKWLGKKHLVIRTMPNTPALVRAGMTGLYATPEVDEKQRRLAEKIMRAVGAILWVEKEEQLDLITALSGSGPAYFLYFMEALHQAGMQGGLTESDSRFLILQTALGTAKLACESQEPWALLRKRITSPGGTTEQAIKVFEPDLFYLCERAVKAAFKKAKELSE